MWARECSCSQHLRKGREQDWGEGEVDYSAVSMKTLANSLGSSEFQVALQDVPSQVRRPHQDVGCTRRGACPWVSTLLREEFMDFSFFCGVRGKVIC